MSIRVRDLGTILSVWAHPDDETYLAGALMAEAVASGQRVVCVSLTAGELGTDDPITWPPARLARLRRWEAAASMAVLGVTDHRVLDLPDGGLADVEPTEGVALVRRLMRGDGARHHRDLRPGRHDLPPRSRHGLAVGDGGLGGGRPSGAAPPRHRHRRPPPPVRRALRSVGELHDRPAPHGHPGRRPRRPPRGRGARPRPEARRPGGHGVADERRDGHVTASTTPRWSPRRPSSSRRDSSRRLQRPVPS